MTLKTTSSCERNDLTFVVKYYSTSRRVLSRLSLYRKQYVAHQGLPLSMLPRNLCSNVLSDMLPGSSPTACDKLLGCDHLLHRPPLDVCAVIERSISRPFSLSSKQMTKAHPTLMCLLRHPLDQVPARCRSEVAVALLFFDPTRHSVTTHPKAARESTQRATFLISSQYLLAFIIGISIARRVVTALAATISTEKLLFALWRESIPHDILASAVTTLQFNSNHDRDSLTYHSTMSHYQKLL